MSTSYIIGAARTPLGKFLGSLATCPAPKLGGVAIRAALQRAVWGPLQNDRQVDQVIMGQVMAAGAGQAPARQAAMWAGLPESCGAVTINKVCGSGLYSVMLADMAIRAGQTSTVVAGGMESMSQVPYLLPGARMGWKYGTGSLIDALEHDGLRCAEMHMPMGVMAEFLAKRNGISRADQDAWALRSHQLAVAAAANESPNYFGTEVSPVQVPGKVDVEVARDELPRNHTTLEKLSKLPGAFAGDAPATTHSDHRVTAGNSSALADGAAALVVVNAAGLEASSSSYAFRIVGHTSIAVAHNELFTAPVSAVERLLTQTGTSLNDIACIEINEAFAVQTIACMRKLKLDEQRVNVRGGAIALGHPLGASGARVLVTLLHTMLAQSSGLGLATLCIGGGEAVAMLVERVR